MSRRSGSWVDRFMINETLTLEVSQDECGGFLITLREINNGTTSKVEIGERAWKAIKNFVAEVQI